MTGPPITVTCGCGEIRYLAYGERWTCEKCGTSWNTAQIPREDYDAVLRLRRRHIIAPATVFVLAAITVALFIVLGRVQAVILLPFAMMAWFIFGRPFQRRRLAAQMKELPEWRLTPE
jgi:Flp pilus assembly protein TadB